MVSFPRVQALNPRVYILQRGMINEKCHSHAIDDIPTIHIPLVNKNRAAETWLRIKTVESVHGTYCSQGK